MTILIGSLDHQRTTSPRAAEGSRRIAEPCNRPWWALRPHGEGLESLSPEMRREMYKRMNLKVIANPNRTLTIEAIPDTNYLPVIEAARKEVSQVRTYAQS